MKFSILKFSKIFTALTAYFQNRVVKMPTSSGSNQAQTRPDPKNINSNPTQIRQLICSPNHARKKTKVKLDIKNLAILSSYFGYNFVHLRQKARLRPKLSPTFSQL